ncbi:hypothetical protein GCM10007894_12600 [Paraferrimonas haliotis]|uniref:Uncharacterized protein n=1 Tax=Paraferrimonas haliotis TaxID=2013866 RepID=A0AA37WW52_9GAMM|nr:hypothetical protein GCM10007894_12600 [Paraferrimonas haliotis]
MEGEVASVISVIRLRAVVERVGLLSSKIEMDKVSMYLLIRYYALTPQFLASDCNCLGAFVTMTLRNGLY